MRTKIILTGLVIILPCRFIWSQASGIQWLKSQGGSKNDFVNGVIEGNDGNYVITGTTTSGDGDLTVFGNDTLSRNAWVYKVDKSTGNIIPTFGGVWGGDNNDQVWRSTQTSTWEYLAIGFSIIGSNMPAAAHVTVNHHGAPLKEDIYLIRLDENGQNPEHFYFGGTGDDWGDFVVEADNGNYIICGRTESNDGHLDLTTVFGAGNSLDLWIAEISKFPPYDTIPGRNLRLGGTGKEDFGSIAKTNDGGYIVSCRTTSTDYMVVGNHGAEDIWVLKLDSALNLEWSKCYGGTGSDAARQILQDVDGNYIVAGGSDSDDGDLTTNLGATDYWVFKIDAITHGIMWQKNLGGSTNENALSVAVDSDGGYVVTGRTFSNDSDITLQWGMGDCWTAKLNAANPGGPLDWVSTIGGTEYDGGNFIIRASDGGLVVAGEGKSPDGDIGLLCPGCYHPSLNPNAEEAFVFKYNGSMGVDPGEPLNIGVNIYPNPFITSTSIELFGDIKIKNAEMIITDLSGKIVKQISDINSSCIQIRRDNMSSGIYMCQLFMKEKLIFSEKLILQ